MDQQLISYIKENLKKGYSIEEIKNTLIKARYDRKIIEDHLDYITKKINLKNIKKIIFIPIVSILIFSIIIFINLRYNEKSLYLNLNNADCTKFSSEDMDLCYELKAVNMNDESLCSNILNKNIRIYCIAVLNKDFELCKDVRGKIRKSRCFTEVVNRLSDYSLCNNIDDFDIRNYCIATSKINYELCNNVVLIELKNDCFSFIAKEVSNDSLCNSITRENKRIICYAVTTHNTELCKDIKDPNIFNRCILMSSTYLN